MNTNMYIAKIGTYLRLVAFMFVVVLLQWGCKDDGCKVDGDCPSGKLCQSGKCQSAPDGGGDSDGDSDGDNDTDSDTDSDSDGDTNDSDTLDGGPDTDNDSEDSDTTTEGCEATQQNAETCSLSCQCYSGHCENNLCCMDGECCETPDDCENDLCLVPTCDGNGDCVYRQGSLTCGAEDTDGAETCMGDSVCNDDGQCVPLTTPDCGNFTPDEIVCTADAATQECHADCTLQNVTVNCVEGALCESGSCVTIGLENGDACQEDGECSSNHCANGFCCQSGECCVDATDCSTSLCVNSACAADHRCVYNFTGFSCGMEDPDDGDTCTGDNRCDGAGNCVALSICDAEYAWDPSADEPYTCGTGVAVETCYEAGSCVNAGYCNDGYDCVEGDCVFVGMANGGACTDSNQCGSGYCDGDFCCPTGDCCAEDSDCTDTTCNAESFCDADNMCQPAASDFCGYEDQDGDPPCVGDNRCDGVGNCVPMTACDGAYAWDGGSVTCSVGIVNQTCWDECFSPTDGRCNDGFDCSEAGDCVAFGPGPDGWTCENNSECESGNCGDNNICCPAGKECCSDVSECDGSQCVTAYCTGNFACDYQPLACGVEDDVDEPGNGSGTCTGTQRCNGEGDCVDVDLCLGAYAADETYTCQGGAVAEDCYESCSTSRQCNDDATCSAEFLCVDKSDNGGPCEQNSDCLSNYCTSATQICCDAGICCNDNQDCGSYLCDTVAHACIFSCANGGVDSDAVCTPLGNFHCDNGQCNEDLDNGEWPCNEASDCASNHCDAESQVCCASGACCLNDDDCDGTVCGSDGQCGAGCTANDDSLCADGYHCDANVCVENIQNGQGNCIENSDCESGNCTPDTGICCVAGSGDCCADASDCDDGNGCTQDVCSAFFQCYSLPKSEGESCDDGNYCNGVERCDESGACVDAGSPCPPDTVCTTSVCDEQQNTCNTVVKADMVGEACTDPLFCLGGRAMECTPFGLCDDPDPTGPKGCEDDTFNLCTQYVCDEENDACTETVLDNGVVCDDDDSCNGVNECWNGQCVRGPDLPCDDYNPCTDDPCTDNAGTPVCGTHTDIADDQPCNDNFACYGSAPYCMAGTCIPSENPCKDGSGIATIYECQESYYGSVSCGNSISNEGGAMGCGDTQTFDSSIFVTREYFTYNADYCPGDYPGPEALIAIELPNPGMVTVTVSNVSPSMNVFIMDLGNWQDETTCEEAGTNTLTIDSTSPGYYLLILEADDDFPPDSFDVTVSACP
jgi:hypothetical protein